MLKSICIKIYLIDGKDDLPRIPSILWFLLGSDSSLLPPLISREMELTDGAVFLSQMPSLINLSLISQENIPGFCLLSSSILFSTSGVATLGFDPPITPGRIDPVSC